MGLIHAQVAQAIVLYYASLGLWGLWLGMRRQPVDGAYRGALALALGVATVQVLTGVVLLLSGAVPREPEVHWLYGLSLLVSLPLAHLYLAGKSMSPPVAYGLACLFMAGLAIRAITTG